jgi:hypothetical protein
MHDMSKIELKGIAKVTARGALGAAVRVYTAGRC